METCKLDEKKSTSALEKKDIKRKQKKTAKWKKEEVKGMCV